ncbi:N-acetylmuramoyl-L-alanine amidase [Sulfitobacter sp. AS92]|uniref:N-acetylmuramoyl-L-alanine amidase n=1 Tax=Sulfitobacter sp. AS92 TaxID=3135783 RepID=UPI00316D0AE4
MTYSNDLQRRIDDALSRNDVAELDAILDEHFQVTEASRRPYDAAVEPKPEYREALDPGPFEGSAVVNWANRISRAKRLAVYRVRTGGNFRGTRIVSEGDSWFQYPIKLKDVIDVFMAQDDFAVLSLDAAGDLVEHMAVRREYHGALSESGAPVMLLSGGGNDLLGDGRLEQLLLPYADGASAEDLVDAAALEGAVAHILGYYRHILTDVAQNHPQVMVFGHGYDTPFPIEGARYFGQPFADAGIPLDIGRDVIRVISAAFAEALRTLEDAFDNYRFVDLTGTVGNHRNSWDDELHPENAGFARAAAPLMDAVRAHVAKLGDGFEIAAVASPPETPFETGWRQTVVLDPGHGGTTDTDFTSASWNNAVGPAGTLEKRWTLDVCRRARPMLEARGYRVLLTRDADVSVSGPARRDVAREVAAEVFVSVHFNGFNGSVQGTETWLHSNTASSRSIRLMRSVQSAMLAELGHRDRNATQSADGIIRKSLSVLHESGHHPDTAVCLNEVSFMDVAAEEQRIMQPSYRDRIAGALATGIADYLEGGLEDGFEMAGIPVPDEEGNWGDALDAIAAREGLSVAAYLARPARLPVAPVVAAPPAAAFLAHAVDGSALAPASGGSALDALWADIAAPSGDPDAGEDAFIDPSRELDLTSIGADPDGRARFAAAYAPVIAAADSPFEAGGFDLTAFQSFVDGLGLRHFSATELLYLGWRNQPGQDCEGRNAPPPSHLWENMRMTAQMLDEIRHRLGAPVRILSAYRDQSYNTCIGGAAGSLHMRFNAIDWTCSGGTVERWRQVAREVRESDPRYAGGIKGYFDSNFVHVDTRGTEVDF